MVGSSMAAVVPNVPGLLSSSLSFLPLAGRALFRDSPEQAPSFCAHLDGELSRYAEGQCTFDAVDVSRVRWSSQDFSALLGILQSRKAVVKRFMAFRCGLKDDALTSVAAWLCSLPPQSLPSEIHLSHNEITNSGFEILLRTIEQKRNELQSKPPPIWLRTENNKVDRSACDAYVTEGRIVYASKVRDVARMGNRTASVAMPPMFGYGNSGMGVGNTGAQVGQPPAQAASLTAPTLGSVSDAGALSTAFPKFSNVSVIQHQTYQASQMSGNHTISHATPSMVHVGNPTPTHQLPASTSLAAFTDAAATAGLHNFNNPVFQNMPMSILRAETPAAAKQFSPSTNLLPFTSAKGTTNLHNLHDLGIQNTATFTLRGESPATPQQVSPRANLVPISHAMGTTSLHNLSNPGIRSTTSLVFRVEPPAIATQVAAKADSVPCAHAMGTSHLHKSSDGYFSVPQSAWNGRSTDRSRSPPVNVFSRQI